MRKFISILLIIFIFGYVLRILFLPQNALTFGYDQARDAVHALQIARGDIQILGPSSSTPGLYHGVLYFYVLAPAYLIGSGSPIVAAYWIAFINALTIFTVGILAYLFTKNKHASYFSAFLYAISFEATQYATWLSNPTLGMFTVPLMYLGLWMWITKRAKKYAPIIAAIGLGTSIQAEIFLAYHAAPLALWLWLSRKNITKRQCIVFVLTLIASLSTMILSEVKFGFKGIGGISSLLNSGDALVAAKGFGDFVLLFLNQLGRVYSMASYPGNVGYGAAIVIICMVVAARQWKKGELNWQPFIVTWLLSHITVTTLGGTSTPFLLVGISPAVSLLLGILCSQLWKQNRVLSIVFIAILVFGNMSAIFKENPRGSTIFSIQKDMLLSNQLPAIEYMYTQAQEKPFSINSLTSPLWVNIVWSYLFEWYGNNQYGYVPGWHGRGQEGQVTALPVAKHPTRYLIIEPMAGIPFRYLDDTLGEENVSSHVVSEKNFGEIRIQSRLQL